MSGKTLKKILTIVIWILLIALLIVNLTVISMEKRGSYDYIEKMNLSLLKVTGGSMEPVLHDGDIILVKQEAFEDLKVGDIVVFEGENELITHTIIADNGDEIVTQGAANPLPDDAITVTDYRAKVVCRVPLLGALWTVYTNRTLTVLWALFLVMVLFGKDIFSLIYDLFSKNGADDKQGDGESEQPAAEEKTKDETEKQ